ncbi:MAG: glycosyltransferase family 2 protein [Chloroflexi bacterium]|nr:glycosyltransferase family 2 protein [Chloroflexota bacterium]
MPDGSPWQCISIVTPSYNQGQFIEETIRSVLLQGYPNLEYIIMDGGSNDESVEIIRKYEPWLAYWVSQPDGGQADAINKGFAHTTGVILGWLNSDDLLCPRALYRIAYAFHDDTSLNVTCGFRKLINSESKFKGNWVHGKPTAFVLKRLCFIAQETVYWRREVWEHVGSLDANFLFALDYE